ncbi:MAG: hypothetical protein DHS20C18_54060 [Saprospiraceae bacterium]|nr:MAG: hypothetical protein DHS20C18_54060 [Saprospiraceae bacterium]
MPKKERQTIIDIASYRLPLKIIWERRRNIRAAIGKQAILLRLPLGYKVNERDEIEKIKGWLVQLANKKEGVLDRLAIKHYEDGQVLTVGDHQYLLSIRYEDRKTHTARLRGKCIELKLAVGDEGTNLQHNLKHLLSRVIAQEFLPAITKRVLDLNDQYFRMPIKGVKLKYNFSNWGSCSHTGNINLSTRLLFAPPDVIDYVIIHELAHLLEMNHSPKFWSIVEKAMPDYSEKEGWLQKNGHFCDF